MDPMTKSCTNDLRALDVRRLARDGLLKPGPSFGWNWTRNGTTLATINLQVSFDSVTLDYRHKANGGEWQGKRYPVRLVHTPCNLGGDRVWWQCPAAGCGRRVALLYVGSSGIFACRHCNRLAYQSLRESDSDRVYRPANKLRERLGWVPGVAFPPGDKPKGMHWRTYARLMLQYKGYAEQVMISSGAMVEALKSRLHRMNL
jgi:hypothetical protein